MDSSLGGDDKWKLSKKGRSRSGRQAQHLRIMDGAAAAGATVLSRSYSATVTGTRRTTATATTSSSSSSHHHQGQQGQEQQQGGQQRLSKKCVEAVKEHRARFYIVRRCVSMLVCWRDY